MIQNFCKWRAAKIWTLQMAVVLTQDLWTNVPLVLYSSAWNNRRSSVTVRHGFMCDRQDSFSAGQNDQQVFKNFNSIELWVTGTKCPLPYTMSGSRHFVPVTRNSCWSSVYGILLKFENLPVIVSGRKRILSDTHEIVPDSDRWPAVISCTAKRIKL